MADQGGNIKQFNSPIDQLQPNQQAAQFVSRSAATEGELYRRAGAEYKEGIDNLTAPVAKIIDEHNNMQDISQLAHTTAAMTANLQNQWNTTLQTTTDLHDHSIQDKFLNDTLEPQLEQLQSAASTEAGQKWALARADELRQHYTATTSADMSTRAGQAVIKDSVGQLNQLSSATYKDPSLLDQSLTQANAYYDSAMEHNVGRLNAEQLSKIDTIRQDASNELVKNAIKGLADNQADPQGIAKAKALLDSGAYDKYLPKDEQATMNNYLREQVRQRNEAQTTQYLQQKRQQEIQQQATVTDLFNKSYDEKTGLITFKPEDISAIMKNPNLPGETRLNIERMAKENASYNQKDDTAQVQDNFKLLGSGQLTQQTLLQQGASGQLTTKNFNFFDSLLKQTPEAVAEKGALTNAMQQQQKLILTPPAPGIPPTEEQRQKETAFTTWFMAAYQSAKQDPAFKGMSGSQVYQTLLSSTDPKGLLTPEKLAPFLTSPQQMLSDGLKNVGPLPSGLAGNKNNIADTADATSFNKATKQTIYLVGGKWVDATGKEVKQ